MLNLEQESEIDRGLPLPSWATAARRYGKCRGEDSNLHWNRSVTTSFSFSLRSSRTLRAMAEGSY